jgi:hypothetical protein
MNCPRPPLDRVSLVPVAEHELVARYGSMCARNTLLRAMVGKGGNGCCLAGVNALTVALVYWERPDAQ